MNAVHEYLWGRYMFLVLLLAAGVFLWGCDQGLTETDEPGTSLPESLSQGVMSTEVANRSGTVSGEQQAINNQLRAISRAVAKALADDQLRQRIYGRAMERFDGETNVLWEQLEASVASQGSAGPRRWNAVIEDHLPPDKAHGTANKLENTIARAGELLGGPLHLYWVFAENFESDELPAPLVTFTPVGVDADDITDIVAYDAGGNEIVVNEQVAKKRPVVVVASNERVGDASVGTNLMPPPCLEPTSHLSLSDIRGESDENGFVEA